MSTPVNAADQSREPSESSRKTMKSTPAGERRRPLFKPVRGVIIAGLIGALAFACGVALTSTSGWLIVRASERPVILTLLTAIVAVRTFGIGRPVFRYLERLVSHNAALGDLTERRTDAYRQLLPLTPARLGGKRRADLLSGVVRDLDDEVDVQVRVLVPLITTVVASLAALAATFAIHQPAGLVLAISLVAAVLVGWLDLALERHGQKASLKARGQVDRVAHIIANNATELHAIGAAGEPLAWHEHAQRNVRKAAAAQARGRALGVLLTLVTTGLATVCMAWTLDGEVRAGAINGPFAALLLLTPLAMGDVLGLIPDAVGSLARSSAARDRMQTLLSQTPAIVDAPGVSERVVTASVPRLQLREASASWTGAKTDTGPLTFRVEPGEHVAITGSNGSGKSTLLAVLARHLELSSGSYFVDGQDVSQLPLERVRDLIAIVDDDPHVFAGTLRANLLLARPDADDDECLAALRGAGLADWVARLPDGLDTELGENLTGDAGTSIYSAHERSVSGGERARLGVARALLSQRPIVLLDEPVAHLDTPTADAVIRDVLRASEHRTVIMVAHHSVAFDAVDRVVDLADLAV